MIVFVFCVQILFQTVFNVWWILYYKFYHVHCVIVLNWYNLLMVYVFLVTLQLILIPLIIFVIHVQIIVFSVFLLLFVFNACLMHLLKANLLMDFVTHVILNKIIKMDFLFVLPICVLFQRTIPKHKNVNKMLKFKQLLNHLQLLLLFLQLVCLQKHWVF